MDNGRIKIIIEEGKTSSVEAELVNGTIWMPKFEIARLFNVFDQKIEMNLRSIFKSRLLWEDDVTHTCRYMDKGIEKQTVYYNLEVLIFLSYRINSLEAKILRQFIHTALRERFKRDKIPEQSIKIVWFYNPAMNYLWN